TDHGFEYLADHFVGLASTHANPHGAPDVISPLPIPMRLSERKRKSAQIGPEGVVHHSVGVDFLAVSAENRAINRIERCKLILYPVFRPSTALEFVPLNSTEAKLLLMQALHPIQGAASKHSARTKAFSEAVPAVAVYFSDYNSFSGQ